MRTSCLGTHQQDRRRVTSKAPTQMGTRRSPSLSVSISMPAVAWRVAHATRA